MDCASLDHPAPVAGALGQHAGRGRPARVVRVSNLVGFRTGWQDRPMKTSDDYCPVAQSVEVLGARWCLLLVRELLRGVGRFNELERSVPGISRSVLAQRLRHLEREGWWTGGSGPTGAAPTTG